MRVERQLELAPSFAAALGGRILPNAHAAGDLDADGQTELVFGSVTGALAVFKVSPDELVLWRSCRVDGAVTAICVDDRAAHGDESAGATSPPRVVAATSEGKCYVFQLLEAEEPFAPVAELSVALNASAVATVGDELVVGTRDGRILVFSADDAAVGKYRQAASFEVAAEIDAMQAFSAPLARTGGPPVLLIWCTSGEIFCYARGGDGATTAPVPGEDGTRSVALWNGHSDEREDLAFMVDGVSVGGVPDHVAHVSMGDRVVLASPLLEKLWDVQLPEAIVGLDKLRLSPLGASSNASHGADALVACTWSGQLYVIENSEARVRFRVMLPASSMFTAQMARGGGGGGGEPVVVVVTTSGAIFVFAGVGSTISRALDRSTLMQAIEKSAALRRLDTEDKRERVLARLGEVRADKTSGGGAAGVTTAELVRAIMAGPLPASGRGR